MPHLSTAAPPHRIAEASFGPANRWTVESGREYSVIDGVEKLDPFFLSVVGAGDQWLFCSSGGPLSAGRTSPETSLFPYYTADKITDNWNCTGPWTAMVCEDALWNPFRPSIALLSPIRRRLLKSLAGDELVFDEFHGELGLRFSYRWLLSDRYGFVRKAKLVNEGAAGRDIRIVDGIDNFLPAGIDSRMQLHYSCLADAYKVSELDCGGRLLVHRLASGITDAPIPLESLRATTVWSSGLGDGPTYMVRRDAENFLRGQLPPAPDRIRARRGAMFQARELSLHPGESVDWMMVAEIGQSQQQVGTLRRQLAEPGRLDAEVDGDIERGRRRLRELIASADGFQHSADRDATLYHYQNTLCNILRGGVPENGCSFTRDQFLRHLENHNRPLHDALATAPDELPELLDREQLLTWARSTGKSDTLRLAEEYLPLVLSRRHGDPSRPWNQFAIRVQDESGQSVHHFEGNWRDIFQNWEALAWAHPECLGGFISKFLNASTADGFNPYRITSEGIDWEVPDHQDPWVTIGYWGDHQVVYLLKLLELEARIHPDRLAKRLDSGDHVFADVPYRIKSWAQILEDPRDTVDFDAEHHARLMERKSRIGSDGLLLQDQDGQPLRVTLAEKLILPAAVKLANLVPGGGVWMNTQKPEWNDANNALAGYGLSVVTACYLYRYLGFLERLIEGHRADQLRISPPLATLVKTLGDLLADDRWQHQDQLGGTDRFALVASAGRAAEKHRSDTYSAGTGAPVPLGCSQIRRFLHHGRAALKGVLNQNRRADGLWHSYNVLAIRRDERTMEIERLPLMLEGQVAVLSAGILEPAEAVELLQSLPTSDLWSARHRSYLLYPDRELPRFTETNRVADDEVSAIGTLTTLLEHGDTRILVADAANGFRFHPSLTSAYSLATALDELAGRPEFAEAVSRDRPRIEALYEAVFQHQSFTGRSGRMFGFEGLGCVYWHMVSKLMLAAQEVTLSALDAGAGEDVLQRLTAAYYSIQAGLGFRKPACEYGAFPAEPYSHSPAHAGAQQPGLTGQVKEGILCRLGELGVDYHGGRLRFRPRLLRNAEFDGLPVRPDHPELAPGTISFTLAGIPVTYHRHDDLEQAGALVRFGDGSESTVPDAFLDPATTSDIANRSGRVSRIDVHIPGHWLVT